MQRLKLGKVVERLAKLHGKPKPPPSRDPWLLILWENVAYLADDERRRAAWELLRKRVGSDPDAILAASDEALLAVTGHGILAKTFVEKLRRCALIAKESWPIPRTKKALCKFPGIGEPGAEKILLFAREAPALALDSNGLRVLVRLGFAREQKNYSTTYRLVREAVAPEIEEASAARDFDWLVSAHQLLRRHGQEICKQSTPRCELCPLIDECPSARRGGA